MKWDCLISWPCPRLPLAQPITIVITSLSCLNTGAPPHLLPTFSCLVNVSMLWVLSTLEKYSSPSRKNISYAVQQKLSTGIIIHISNPSNLYNTYVALLINTTLTPALTEHFLLPILYVSQTSRVGRLNPLHSEVCNNIPCSQVTFPDNT